MVMIDKNVLFHMKQTKESCNASWNSFRFLLLHAESDMAVFISSIYLRGLANTLLTSRFSGYLR